MNFEPSFFFFFFLFFSLPLFFSFCKESGSSEDSILFPDDVTTKQFSK